MSESRKYERVREDCSINYRIITLGEATQTLKATAGSGLVENVSEGGMLFEAEEPIPMGTFLELEYHIENVEAALTLMGRVVRVEEMLEGQKYEIGIKFTHYFSKDRDTLKTHLFFTTF